jgi:HAE1 family hydrophobic/amphiphilic exporter-1
MLAASVLAIFFIPVSFDVVEKFGHWIGLSEKPTPKPEPAEETKGAHV